MALEGLSPDLISALPHLGNLDDEDKREVLDIIDRLQEIQSYKNARLNFMDFVHSVLQCISGFQYCNKRDGFHV